MPLLGRGARCGTSPRFWPSRQGIDGGAQFLAVAERQTEFSKIVVGQRRQYARVDPFGTEPFGVLRKAYLVQPACNVDGSLSKTRPIILPKKLQSIPDAPSRLRMTGSVRFRGAVPTRSD